MNANYSRASTEVDSIASLADPASWTDRIRYEDTNGNGLLDDGDRIAIHLDPTGENAYDTYILDLAAFPGFPQSERQYGGLYILNGPRGPYSIPGVSSGGVQLRFVADRLNGSVNSTLEVAGMGTPTSPPYVSCTFTLYTGGPGSDDGTLAETPVVLQGNRTMDYDDRNGNGLLDRGDRFVIGGLRNQSSASLGLRCGGGYGNIEWYPGHGYVALPFPPMDFTSSTGRPPYRITARVAYLHPELALNHTVIVTLREDTWSYPPTQAVVDGVPLVNGTLGTWPNGTLSFVDADGDAFLSTGDYFNRQGIRTSDYLLEISFRFGGPWHYVDIPGDII